MHSIQQQFHLIAKAYDANRRKFIPCFDDYYQHTTRLILSNRNAPERVLDLGAGTGLLASYWLAECETAEYVLVDIAADMLEVSRKRFAGFQNVHHQVMDYTKQLPDGAFDAVISALSIHHLEDAQKEALFRNVYERLPAGGIFVNYDQFCAGTPHMRQWFDSYWENQLLHSGLSDTELALWKERRKLDRECSVEAEREMLRRCGFSEVECVFVS